MFEWAFDLGFAALVALAAVLVWLGVVLLGDCDLVVRFKTDPAAGSYAGKVVFITGASSGIGEALAEALASKGATLVLAARREDRLREVAAKCRSLGGTAEVLCMDMLDTAAHAEIVEGVVRRHGRIDVLVNNAGRSQRALIEETDVGVGHEMFDLNVFSVFNLTRVVVGHMLKQGSGQIVVTSSVAGKVASPISGMYAASKHAVQGFFNTLRMETAYRGLDVLLVCPGPVQSEIVAHAFTSKVGEKTGEATAAADKSNRMSAERCAQLIVRGMYHRLHEIWVSPQPILLFVYLAVFFPALADHLGTKYFGPARVEGFRKGITGYETVQGFNVFRGAGAASAASAAGAASESSGGGGNAGKKKE